MANKMVRTAMLGGRRYRITQYTCDGWVAVPGDWELNVVPQMRGKRELVTFIHEVRHAQNPAEPEKVVERRSEELGRLLWRLGYRRRRNHQ